MMLIKYFILPVFLLVQQNTTIAQSVLEGYIREGIDSNEGIKQQNFVLERSLYALEEAKALGKPNVVFETEYTLAAGGRTIDVPIGDIINPAYATLNELTQSSRFPQLENASELLNPNNFYNVKFRTTYPILNKDIGINERLKGHQVELQKTEVEIYKRELEKNIKSAYYQLISAREAEKIYKNAEVFINESIRVNEGLFKYNKVNQLAVSRSKNELTKIRTNQLEAARVTANAQAYLNFLLNRPLTTDTPTDTLTTLPSTDILAQNDYQSRPELQKLDVAIDLNTALVDLSQTYKKPKLNAFVDVGMQNFDFKVNSNSPYVFGGLSLSLDVFTAGKNEAKVKQAFAEKQSLISNKKYVNQQLGLQLFTAQQDFLKSLETYRQTEAQITLNEAIYAEASRIYKEGKALNIEVIEAQNQLINAQLQTSLKLYEAWKKHADVENALSISILTN